MAANLTTMEQIALEKAKDHFGLYGVVVDKVSGLYISLPEEVQKAVDAKASMTVLGTDYMGYQTGQAVRDAAKNPSGGGGIVGAGVGMGAGLGMGYVMMDQMGRPRGPGGAGMAAGGANGAVSMMACNKCGAPMPMGSTFCPKCGLAQVQENQKPAKAPEGAVVGVVCPGCGKGSPKGVKFCPECGGALTAKCPGCGAMGDADDKFCQECGKKMPTAAGAGKCTKCGADAKGAKFCPECGAKTG